jgi:hypothetical protein
VGALINCFVDRSGSTRSRIGTFLASGLHPGGGFLRRHCMQRNLRQPDDRQFYTKTLKRKVSEIAFSRFEQVRPSFAARKAPFRNWSLEPLIFPTFGRREPRGQAATDDGNGPVGQGTLMDRRGAPTHAGLITTGNVYLRAPNANVARAVHSRATAIFERWSSAWRMGRKSSSIRKALETPADGFMTILRSGSEGALASAC